jgi:predicted transcriptional regulator of viral defense system
VSALDDGVDVDLAAWGPEGAFAMSVTRNVGRRFAINDSQKIDISCNVGGEMARPNLTEQVVLDYVSARPDRVLDRQLDDPSIQDLARSRGLDRVDLSSVMKRMHAKDLIHPLQRGRWVVSPGALPSPTARLGDFDLVADAVLRRLDTDYYLSWHSALWHYGLIDQQSRRIYVAVTKRKRPVRLGLATVSFVTVTERKFFGSTRIEDLEWPVWMASIEKALVDSFDQPRLATPVPLIANALKGAHRRGLLDPELLVDAAVRFGSPTLNRRLGFFMDLYDIPGTDPLALRIGRAPAVPLAPGRKSGQVRPPVNPRWRVYEDPSIIGTALEPK